MLRNSKTTRPIGILLLLACAGAAATALAEDRGPCAVQGSCAMPQDSPYGLD